MRRRIAIAALLAVVGAATTGCASGGSQWREVSPTAAGVDPQSLRFFIKEEPAPMIARSIYVENITAHRIRVTELDLSLCENITTCGTNRVNVDVRAGETVLVKRIRPTLPEARFSFNYRYQFVVLEPTS